MSNFEAMNPTEGGEEVWHVQLASGELRVMTLDQLDESFQEGLVSENTFICQSGMSDWMKLGELAGLDGAGGESPQEDSQTASEEAFDVAQNIVVTESWTASSGPLGGPASLGGMHVMAPPGSAYGANARSFPPVVMGPDSTTPFVQEKPDLEFDTDPAFRARKSRTGLLIAAVAVAGIAGVIVAAQGLGSKSDPMAPAAGVQAAMMAAPVAQAPEVAPAPAVAPATDAPRFSDDAKKALMAADKLRAEKNKARLQQRADQRQEREPRRRVKSAAPFHKGGNPHDPLNSSL